MADDAGLTIDFQPAGRNGAVHLTARFADGSTYTDKIDAATADGRKRFVADLCKGRKGLDKKAVAAELERIADAVVTKADGESDGKEKKKGPPNQADILVGLAAGSAELFHTPGGYDSEGYATVTVGDGENGEGGHKETWRIGSAGFRKWLARLFWLRCEKAPGCEAVQAAVNVLSGMAVHDGPEYPVAVRIAEHNGSIYLDLADDDWRAVEVTANGWRVVGEPPVRFVRRRGMLALPPPAAGGGLDELRQLVNLPDRAAWILFVAWMVAAVRPGRPFPILCANGEQGSAKSSLCRMARALLDPNKAPLRRPPREARDLMIAATNGWVVAYDNLSGIAPDLSDALCCLATGGGFGTRELYSDDEEKLFDATRPIMLNGIEDVAVRPDLLDRAVMLSLPEIKDEDRRDEETLWRRFDKARPRLLGALLDAVAAGLRNLPGVRLERLPRMADFARWVVGCEPALPWEAGAFLAAYRDNRGAANAVALEAAVIYAPVLAFLDKSERWEGMASDLLRELERCADEATRKRKEWPSGPRKLAGDLRRLAPNLRREGVDVLFHREAGGRRRRLIRLERACNAPSRPSLSSQTAENAWETAGRFRDGQDDVGEGDAPDRPGEKPAFYGPGDGRDGRDGVSPVCSGGGDREPGQEG